MLRKSRQLGSWVSIALGLTPSCTFAESVLRPFKYMLLGERARHATHEHGLPSKGNTPVTGLPR